MRLELRYIFSILTDNWNTSGNLAFTSGVHDSKGAVTLQTAAGFDYKSMTLFCPFLLSLIFIKLWNYFDAVSHWTYAMGKCDKSVSGSQLG